MVGEIRGVIWLVLHFVHVGEISGVALLVKFQVSSGVRMSI